MQIAATPVDNMVLRNYKSPLLLLVIDGGLWVVQLYVSPCSL
jgi:hypothetical protein